MLRFLSIRHLAVIDAVEVEFGPGLNVLTGETGAGKSILVGAVGLLLGGRATAEAVRTGEEQASVEAIFDLPGGHDELIIRREVTAQGRSRAFVNGSLTTAAALRELAGGLVELHGQHEHHTLLDAATHLAVLDAFGELETRGGEVGGAFASWRAAAAELERVRRALVERDTRKDLVAFQSGELTRAALKPGEDQELAAVRQVLASAERVERLSEEAYAALYDRDDAVLAALGGVWRRVAELAEIDPVFASYLEARDGIKSQLEDLARHLRSYADGIEASPSRLQQVEERLALLEQLKRKYGPTLADVIARRDALAREVADFDQGDARLADLARAYDVRRAVFLAAAQSLSAARRAVADDFATALERLLAELAMERTRFEVRFASQPLPEAAWTAAGIDAVEFFVSPNPGEELRPLARTASGGELSRIMLAVKTLTAASRHGFRGDPVRPPSGAAPGLVFDEVDAGIGGRVATVVGRKLHALGSVFQVLCITHLPQIAALADAHYRIEKRVERGRTHTSVSRLDRDARVDELARMLGGEAITDAGRASARELLSFGDSKAKGESERAKAKPRKRS